MKTSYLFRLFLFLLCVAGFIGCDDKDNAPGGIRPSVNNLTFSGEGDSATITFASGDWKIIGVMNGRTGIAGKIYDENYKLQDENVRLELDATGYLKCDDHFLISRTDPLSLKVEVFENLTNEDYNIVIMLQSGDQIENIYVFQSQSLGYDFEKIEYTLLPDSYKKTWYSSFINMEYSLPPNSSTTDVYYPFQMEKDMVTFNTDTYKPFMWIQRDQTVLVDVPHGVYQGELYYSSEKAIYSNRSVYFPIAFPDKEYLVTPPEGDSKGYIEIEGVEFKASYRIYIRNRVTQKIKTYDGILRRRYPTGNANTVWL